MERHDTASDSPVLVVVMGVAGSGKSTVGELLAQRLGVDYADADDFHHPDNVAKMAEGRPLDDDDRAPWLEEIGQWLAERSGRGAVVTCSAIKVRYRDVLRSHAPDAWFLHVSGSPELITERVAQRTDHFMPPSLVASQFEELEAPGPDERAITEDVSQSPDEIVTDFLRRLGQGTRGGAT